MKKSTLLSAIVFFLLIGAAVAQSSEAKKVSAKSAGEAVETSKTLEAKGRQAFEAGLYLEAEQFAIDAKAYAELGRDWYRANGALRRADDRMKMARLYKIDQSDTPLYSKASTLFTDANTAYEGKNFADSMAYSLQVVELLKDIKAPMTQKVSDKPTTYTVRKLPKADCFWRISGYDYIYGDPTKWRRIYEANKEKLQDPNNPDLIQPGMIFVIPR